MKIKSVFLKIVFCALIQFCDFSLFAQKSIDDVLRQFDDSLFDLQSTTAQVAIGFITYEDTDTSGTVANYFQEEIKKASQKTRRIKIIPSVNIGQDEQIVIATRSANFGMKKKKSAQNNYVIDGIYREDGEQIALLLMMRDSDGNIFSEQTAYIPKKEVSTKKLTLYPENIQLAQTIRYDFEETAQNNSDQPTIAIAASMLDKNNNLVNMLHPGDVVRFMVTTNYDCYIAILMIDANGEKDWLPMTNDFMTADVPRYFPDIQGKVLRVANGIFGAEQVVVYAAAKREELPPQGKSEGMYVVQDLARIRKLQLEQDNGDIGQGSFKITYTVVRW